MCRTHNSTKIVTTISFIYLMRSLGLTTKILGMSRSIFRSITKNIDRVSLGKNLMKQDKILFFKIQIHLPKLINLIFFCKFFLLGIPLSTHFILVMFLCYHSSFYRFIVPMINPTPKKFPVHTNFVIFN